ncbi:MAG: AAA family ATPase [Anaerolineae bacterium]|nr:AAA family ATPase [Anaerolineae bacterium]
MTASDACIGQAKFSNDVKDAVASDALALPPNLDAYLPVKLLHPLREPRFNRRAWFSALNHLRSLRYLLSTYVPSHLAQAKLLHPTVGQPSGEWLNGSLLFSDVSGFTALSERLAHQGQEGAEQLTRAINAYFKRMLDILAWSGGILLKFAGDALLVYFPADKDGTQAHWTVRAGQRMMRAMGEFAAIPTALGAVALKMKIGVSSGRFAALSIGSTKRMEYVLLGDPVTRVMGAEGAATAGQIVIDSATFAQLAPSVYTDSGNGFYVVEEEPGETLGDFEIRAETGHARPVEGSAFTQAEMAADVQRLVDQIAALTPYLPHPLVERIIDASEQRRIESEYRLTTVLFTNVTGFESLLPTAPTGNNTSLDHVTRLMSDYFNALHSIVTRYDGVITRIDPYSKGSKVLTLFGAPVAHEDDPERGTRTALEMMAELAGLNARWQHDTSIIQQRTGITHGLTFAGQAGAATRREYTVMGDDVNLAARLMSAGTPGQILLAPSVYAKVAPRFAITALPAIRVKGKTDPIPIYQVDGLAEENPLAGRLRDLPTLLGRQAELATALEVARDALSGHGTQLTLRGPAGIGKSHLAYTLAAHALEMGAQVIMAECHAYTAETPYNAWTSLLHTLAGFTADEDPQQRSEKLYTWLTELGMTDSRAIDALFTLIGLRNPHPPALIPPTPQETETSTTTKPPARVGLFAQLGQRVTSGPAKPREGPPVPNFWKLAQERQEAERQKPKSGQMWQRLEARVTARERERLFAAVSSLVEQLAQRAPLVLLLENAQWMDTLSQALLDYLQTQITAWPVLIVLAQRTEGDTSDVADKNMLVLYPLDEAGTCDLATSMLQCDTSDDIAALCQSIHRHSEGNPLFIEEIARWMQRTGCTTSESVENGLQSSDVLQELIISRVDSLPYSERVAAKDAAIVGDDFRSSDLVPLQDDDVDKASLTASLDGLETAQMVLQMSPADVHYAFRQTVTREFIYNSQPFEKRRTQHARLAEYLEKRYASVLATYAELLAHHFAAAQRWLSAARYMNLSANKAKQRYAFTQAAACYRRALEMLDRLPVQSAASDYIALTVQAHTGLGDIALLTGDFGAATTHYNTARQISAPETPAMVLVKLALMLPTQEQAEEAVACAREAWSLSPLDDAPCLLASSAVLAWLLWREDDKNARAWIDYARPLAATPVDRWTASITALLNDFSGEWEAAQRAHLALGHTDGAALADCRQGDRALHNDDIATALAHYESAAELWKQEDDTTGLALARYLQAKAYWQSGTPAVARAALETALALLGDDELHHVDREAVRAALDIVTGHSTGNWPPWHWQSYKDACCILLLFPF